MYNFNYRNINHIITISGGFKMKRSIIFAIFMIFCTSIVFGVPRIKIVPEYVTPHMLATNSAFAPDSTVATGLRVVARGTFAYLRAWNFGDTGSIISATWTFLQKPTGSNAVLSGITGLPTWQKFKIDSAGIYRIQVNVTATTGTKDTTITMYGANYVGTGGFDNIPAQFPNCMSCHGSNPTFQAIFNRWKVTGHATSFKTGISTTGSGFNTFCFKCHTTGYDKNIFAINNGFDDKARELGWIWSNYAPPKPGNWDTIKNRFPTLAPLASVGCESCHGPGSEHAYNTGDTSRIMKSVDEGNCGACHDSPPEGPYFRQWKNANHSNIVWSNSFAQNNYQTPNDLNNCIRCHDGKGYVNFTYGRPTNTNGMTIAMQEQIACAVCHDPHGTDNPAMLRNRPANSDTLANGYRYTNVGKGIVCLDCHKSRRNAATYVNTRVTSSTWGPHYNSQGDLYLGQNLATFGGPPYRQTLHWQFLNNSCVTCHMAPTDTSAANRDKVGGHALYLHNPATNYDHLRACQSCHAGKTRFDQFIADADYDGDGNTESWRAEMEGSWIRLRIQLPPVGVDSVAWQLIAADSFNVTLRKAYFNYLSVRGGALHGMHNPKYAIDALVASRNALIGIINISYEVPEKFELTQNYPNPFNPSTKFKFSLPKESDVTIAVFDITGRLVKVLAKDKFTAGKYEVDWDGTNDVKAKVASGVYFYRIVAGNYSDVKKMVLVR